MSEPASMDAWRKQRGLDQTRPVNAPLHGGGGGDTLPPMTDDSLKPRVDFLHTAFLWLAGVMVAAITTIIVVAFTLSTSTNARLDKSIETTSGISREVGVVGAKIDEANRRLERIEGKLDQLGTSKGR
jgi:hypothetical protein